MALKTGYTKISYEHEYKEYSCSYCGKYLGEYSRHKEDEIDDISDWEYCPYCGTELY